MSIPNRDPATVSLDLLVFPHRYAVCRLPPAEAVPDWLTGDITCVTRTPEELSLVCREEGVPADVRCEKGWRVLRVAGSLDFGLVGILAALTRPLAAAGISVFCFSTFDTDYVLVRERDHAAALHALTAAGHRISPEGDANTLSSDQP